MSSIHYNYRLKSKFLSLSPKALACWPFFPSLDKLIYSFPEKNSMLHLCPNISPAWNDFHLNKSIQRAIQYHLLFSRTLPHHCPLTLPSLSTYCHSADKHILRDTHIIPLYSILTDVLFPFIPYNSNYNANLLEGVV